MDNDKKEPSAPQPQTAANPSGEPVNDPLTNGQGADRSGQQAGGESEKEQQFKEAQTERD